MQTIQSVVIAVLLTSFISYQSIFAQCSDAGICTIGGHTETEHSINTPLTLNLSYGLAFSGKPESITYNSVTAGMSYRFSNSFSAGAQIPFIFNTSTITDISGIGDLILSANYNVPLSKKDNLRFSIGGKFATGKSDVDSLPLAYQNGAGTNDVLFAVTYEQKEFFFGLGFQNPFGESNSGNYILKRSPDLMLRGGFNFNQEKYSLGLESIIIKRLTKSEIKFPNSPTSNFDPVDNSDFIQANLVANASLFVNRELTLSLSSAFPFLERKENWDGSKRALTVSLGLKFTPSL